LGININKKDSAIVFFSGLTMSITPGKFGEVLKSYLLKQLNGINISRSAPIVFAERLTDVIGLILLSSVGATIYKYGESILIATLICIALMVLVIQSKTISLQIIGFSEKIPIFSNFAHNLHELYESAFRLLILKNLLIAVIISALSWFFECLAMYYTLKAFGLNISLIAATFVFAFSSVAGAVSMLPGGLGVAEGSMTGLLILLNIPKAFAVSATLIIRFCTLWFGVGIGMVTLFLFRKKFI
ncbi:MAG: YbhN family protein, partial [Methanosarcinales archaeon]